MADWAITMPRKFTRWAKSLVLKWSKMFQLIDSCLITAHNQSDTISNNQINNLTLGWVSIEYEMGLSHYKHQSDKSSKSIHTSPRQQIKVVSPYKLMHNRHVERKSILPVPNPPQDFCRTASVPESSMSPGSLDFPCHIQLSMRFLYLLSRIL